MADRARGAGALGLRAGALGPRAAAPSQDTHLHDAPGQCHRRGPLSGAYADAEAQGSTLAGAKCKQLPLVRHCKACDAAAAGLHDPHALQAQHPAWARRAAKLTAHLVQRPAQLLLSVAAPGQQLPIGRHGEAVVMPATDGASVLQARDGLRLVCITEGAAKAQRALHGKGSRVGGGPSLSTGPACCVTQQSGRTCIP